MKRSAGEEWVDQQRQVTRALSSQLAASLPQIPERIEALRAELKARNAELAALHARLAVGQSALLLGQVKKIGNVSCIAAQAEAAKLDSLRQLTERLRDRLGSGVVVLGSVIGGRPQIIVSLKTPRAKAAGVQSVASTLPTSLA